MRTTFAAASILMCLAVVSCKKPAAKEDTPPAPSANPAPNHTNKDKEAKDKDAGDKPSPDAKNHHVRGTKLAFGQKPPKPEKMKAPAVPELPSLATQEKYAPPTKLPVGEYACGSSHSGEHDYPLMCLDDKSHDKSDKIAKLLLPYGHLKDKLAPLPKVVDHREDKTEADVRNQGSAGTCTAFGTSAAIDHYVSMWTGNPSKVSTMELWGKYHQPDLGDALIAMVGQTLGSEDQWPYDAKEAWTWRDCGKGDKSGGACGKPVDKAKLAELEKKPIVTIEQVQWLPKDFELIRHKIAAGRDPVFGVRLPARFKPVGKAGARYIPDYKEESGGHAMALAGYYVGDKGDNYYLLHNSWGTTWGDSGYAWIHEATLQKHMLSGFGILEARPVDAHKAHREGKVCPAGEAPDSHTMACMKECSDGAPMHNGICPEASDCPSGYVNLWGECIGAAPTASGKDDKSGISWKCGPGGCAWTLPKAVGKCSGEPCMVSCPAPDFRVAKDEGGLTCVE